MQKSSRWFLLFLLVAREISAKNCVLKREDGTTIEDEGFSIILPEIEDTEQPGKILLTLIGENVQGINDTTTDSNKRLLYMNATIDGTSIVVMLTEHFVDYEKYETKKGIYITVSFKCQDEELRKLELIQPIRDTNNHDPEFEGAPYVYRLPMPFPSGVKLELLQKISAVDLDITTSDMKFFLDPADELSEAFAISRLSVDPSNSKRQFASLQTRAVLNLRTDTTFHIYANDSVEPVRTGKTTVTIQVDKDNSALSFAKPLYTANCSHLLPEEADGFTPKFTEGDISLGGGTNGITEWTIEDISKKYVDNFKLNASQNFEKIEITLVKPPASFFQESFVALILTAKKVGAAASTVIHLTLPGRQSNEIPEAVPPKEDSSPDSTAVIITLAVLLAIVSAALVACIVLLRRRGRAAKPVEKINGAAEARGEMREVERMDSDPSSNGVPRRSVAFNDTVEEIKVARL